MRQSPSGEARREPRVGDWLWTCREGFERDLESELRLASKKTEPAIAAPALVTSREPPPRREGAIDLTFARQGFPIIAVLHGNRESIADSAIAAFSNSLVSDEPFTLHVWVPDSTDGNRLASEATALEAALAARLPPALAARRLPVGDPRPGGLLAQLCLASADIAFAGVAPFSDALSPFPGGRARMRDLAGAPSRAAMKLEEALAWIGYGPEPGDSCVDLGAAPGGWTFVLLARRARVIAVDPGRLAPSLANRKGVTWVGRSAFEFEPREPVDWLFCDMAWRPLEVAQLLAKWGRKKLARTLVANLKLPMKQKAEHVAKVRNLVGSGGWRDVRTRHLYHDRDEITLAAWRL